MTFYTPLVTELLFFLGCLDDLVKGPCERVAVTYWCVVKEIQTEVLCAGWIRQNIFQMQAWMENIGVGVAAGRMQRSRLHVDMLR